LELEGFTEPDALYYLRSCGILGADKELISAAEHYGYHPLSLALLSGLIRKDFRNPNDIAVARRLNISANLVQRRHHILQLVYERLTETARTLLGRIACLRRSSAFETAAVAADRNEDDLGLDRDLRELITFNLISFDAGSVSLDMHPIVRRYAYERLAEPDRITTHARIAEFLGQKNREPSNFNSLSELQPYLELYHHRVKCGDIRHAHDLYWKMQVVIRKFGCYALFTELLESLTSRDNFANLGPLDTLEQYLVLNNLCVLSAKGGRPLNESAKIGLLSLELARRNNRWADQAITLNILANDELFQGNFRGSKQLLDDTLDTVRRAKQSLNESPIQVRRLVFHELFPVVVLTFSTLAELLACRGLWSQSEDMPGKCCMFLSNVLDMNLTEDEIRSSSRFPAAFSLRAEVCRLRGMFARGTGGGKQRARKLAMEIQEWLERNDDGFIMEDVAVHRWVLGTAERLTKATQKANETLTSALSICREGDFQLKEPDILRELALVHMEQGDIDEGLKLAQTALALSSRTNHVLQIADSHSALAEIARTRGDKEESMRQALLARKFALCDGPPDLTYRVAIDETDAIINAGASGGA
jgi:tetratricopeptide (TPR) repeat protein